MESLKEVLVRVKGLSEEEAASSIEKADMMLKEGKSPEDVLVSLYGEDISQLESLLSPAVGSV